MTRARAVGSPVLVLTIDLAVVGARHRDTRNAVLGEPTAWAKVLRGLDLVAHPRWIRDVPVAGKPLTFGNLERAVPGARSPAAFRDWVDAQFEQTKSADVRPPDTLSVSPAPNATRVPLSSKVEITFDEAVDRLTVNTGSITLETAAGAPITGVVTYDDAAHKATLTPSAPLAYGTTYKVTIKSGNAGVTDLAGNKLTADKTWTFATGAACPCTIFDPATEKPAAQNAVQDRPVELGVRFKAAEDGYITALRFYKQANNVGSHVGHLWGPDGQLLTTVPFSVQLTKL